MSILRYFYEYLLKFVGKQLTVTLGYDFLILVENHGTIPVLFSL